MSIWDDDSDEWRELMGEDVERCSSCNTVCDPWKLLAPGSNETDGMCDMCRPKVVIPDWAWNGPGIGFTC